MRYWPAATAGPPSGRAPTPDATPRGRTPVRHRPTRVPPKRRSRRPTGRPVGCRRDLRGGRRGARGVLEYGLARAGYRFWRIVTGGRRCAELLALDVGPRTLAPSGRRSSRPGTGTRSSPPWSGRAPGLPVVSRPVARHRGGSSCADGAGALGLSREPISLRVSLRRFKRWVGRCPACNSLGSRLVSAPSWDSLYCRR